MASEVKVKEEPRERTEDSAAGEADEKPMSHLEAMAVVKSKLGTVIQADPLLNDLPNEVTLEEIQSQIALEYGQAMTVFVHKKDENIMPIVVVQNGTVLELKKAIKRFVSLKQDRAGGTKYISWRYIWKAYWLIFDGQKLDDDKKLLKEYGIRNRAELKFIKRLKQK